MAPPHTALLAAALGLSLAVGPEAAFLGRRGGPLAGEVAAPEARPQARAPAGAIPAATLGHPAEEADARFEQDLLKALAQPEPDRIAAVLAQGLEAVTRGLAPFLMDPPDWQEGLAVLDDQLWKVVLLLVPQEHHASPAMVRAKRSWDSAFVRTPEIAAGITAFHSSGNTTALTEAVKSTIHLAVETTSDDLALARTASKLFAHFDAIVDLIDGVSAGWDLHAEGQTALAAEAVWRAVKTAVDDVLPARVSTHETYSLVVGTVDGVMSRLTENVLDYRRRVLNSKVCYKRTTPRERTRPSFCREGFEWDEMHTCYPSASTGADCFGPCGGAGMCPSFCGADGACCRRGDKGGPAECSGSTGFVDFAFTKGSSRDYHQCARPGPAAAFRIKACGELELHGLWVRTGAKSGRPRYTLADNSQAVMEWSESRGAWRLYVDNWLGHRRATLYTSPEPSATAPLTGWVAVSGTQPEPLIELFAQSPPSASLLQQAWGLPWGGRRSDFGTHEATCNSQSDEKSGAWCVSKCPPGYSPQSAQTCAQLCGGSRPADSLGMCGESAGEAQRVIAQGAAMIGNGAIKAYVLIDDMGKTGVEADKLSSTINTLVDLGRPFAHPECPDFADEGEQ